MSVPPQADVVVIGGGVMGTSTAFHLAEAGADVVLVEQAGLASGSTSKAAGGVRAQFSDPLDVAIALRSLEALGRFTERPGGEIDLRRVGYLFLLDRPGDVEAFERSVALQNELGVPSRLVTPKEAARLVAARRRARGPRPAGRAGPAADHVHRAARRATGERAAHDRLRDGLLLPPRGAPASCSGWPTARSRPASRNRPTRTGSRACWRWPSAGRPCSLAPGIVGGWTGYYEVSPDDNALVGEASAPRRFLYATGFSGHGFLQGPAIGEIVRDLVLGRVPFVDVSPLSAARFVEGEARPERNVV